MTSDGDDYHGRATEEVDAFDFGTEISSSIPAAYYGTTPTSSYTCSYNLSKQLRLFREQQEGGEHGADAAAGFQMDLCSRTPTGSRSCTFSAQLHQLKASTNMEQALAQNQVDTVLRALLLDSTIECPPPAESVQFAEEGISCLEPKVTACSNERTRLRSAAQTFQPTCSTDVSRGAIVPDARSDSLEREADAAAGFHMDRLCSGRTSAPVQLSIASSFEVAESSSSSCSSSAHSFEADYDKQENGGNCPRTKLTSKVSSFQPLRPTDTRTNAIVSAAHLVLVSCVPPHSLRVEQDLTRDSTKSIIVDLDDAPANTLPAHDILQLTKTALDSVVSRVGSASIVSSRIRKQACGYNLHATIACWPHGCGEHMCWDLMTKGSCPRRKRCRWHHPEAENTVKLNVFITTKGRNTTRPLTSRCRQDCLWKRQHLSLDIKRKIRQAQHLRSTRSF
jgi:hypothetical protein